MADETSWRTPSFRQSVVSKIDEAIRQSGMSPSRNSIEMENHVFQKAKSKEEYLGFVARLILHVREMTKTKRISMGESYRKGFVSTLPARSGGPGGDFVITWEHFDPLQFFKDQFQPRASAGNFEFNSSNQDFQDAANIVVSDADNRSEEESTQACYLPAKPSTIIPQHTRTATPEIITKQARKRHNTLDLQDQILEAEKGDIKILRKENEAREEPENKRTKDDNVAFLDSLLPHIRELSRNDNLTFRIQTMQLLQRLQLNSVASTSTRELGIGDVPRDNQVKEESANIYLSK